MIVLRLDNERSAAVAIQRYYRGYVVRCLRIGPDQLTVSFRVFTLICCDADSPLEDTGIGTLFLN